MDEILNAIKLDSRLEEISINQLADVRVFKLFTLLGNHHLETQAHCFRVNLLALPLAVYSGEFYERELDLLSRSSFLHDVGKLRVPTHILDYCGGLTLDMKNILHKHPEHSKQLVVEAGLDCGEIVLRHHLDNNHPYPVGVTENPDIVKFVHILALADKYDAIRIKRAYHSGHTIEETLNIIKGKNTSPDKYVSLLSNVIIDALAL
jgi:HD-GYP domain-containing protein (c-di-GMP phosphodiesterase class II)